MRNTISLILFVLFCTCSCSDSQIEQQKRIPDSLQLRKDSIVKIEREKKYNDSLEQAFREGKYYFSNTIRLNEHAFFMIDSFYVAHFIKDKEIQQLYFSTEYLTPDNREAYYKKILSGMEEKDLQILRMVWNLDELKKEGSSGGYLSLITIFYRPIEADKNYEIEVKRIYDDRFGTYLNMGFLSVTPTTHEISVMVITTGEMLPLDKWRKYKETE